MQEKLTDTVMNDITLWKT